MTDVEHRLKALMLRALAGDAGAQSELLTIMGRYLRGYFGRRLGADAADLEDLVQETLLALYLKRDTYDRSQPFTPWAYGVARYKLLDHFRKTGRRREAPLEAAETLFGSEDADQGMAKRDLDKLLDTIPERQRGLINAVKIKGLSIAEASQQSGMSESAVKVSIHRAIGAMAKRVRDADR